MDFWLVPVTLIVGAFAYIIVHTIVRARVRELEVRERIAMIERGLVPPPEVDPRGFEKAMNGYDRARGRLELHPARADRPARNRRAGVTLMAIGFGLMLLISVAGNEPRSGIGVGGFLVICGLAFMINGLFERPEPDRRDVPPASGAVAASETPLEPPASR